MNVEHMARTDETKVWFNVMLRISEMVSTRCGGMGCATDGVSFIGPFCCKPVSRSIVEGQTSDSPDDRLQNVSVITMMGSRGNGVVIQGDSD